METNIKNIAIIGGGPGGLIAAEKLAEAGFSVAVYERKTSLGRKFLLAGRGGLNLTHSEDFEKFMTRYGAAAAFLRPAVEAFPPAALREWCEGLGEETFVGSSGRVFPKSFKASPLLRAWRARLEKLGVRILFQKEWKGWDAAGALVFNDGETVKPDATVLALGGASWPRLGADGGWVDMLKAQGIAVAPLRPANCGFAVAWSDVFREKFAGQPVKPVTLTFGGEFVPGEMMISEKGVEGGAIYALSSRLREAAPATLHVDLRPGVSVEDLARKLAAPRGALSFSNYLKKAGGLSPVAAALVREAGGADAAKHPPASLAGFIKALPLHLEGPLPLDRAISTAGGIALPELDSRFMLKQKPGIFAIGEMLDWEAPTGGYLLQATFSTGVYAAGGVKAYLTGIT